MPASTNASYVGRFAPPGYPNTTSTPSALRHSMTASTALIMRASLSARCGRGLGLYGHVGELQLGPAAGAEGVVEHDYPPAAGALPAQLVTVGAVQHGGEQADHRQHRADEEPDEERRALDLADHARGQAHPEREDRVDHAAALAAVSSAGRMRGATRRRTRQRAPLNAWLATVAKPASSARRASSRWAVRSPAGRESSVACTQKQCTRRAPGRTSSAPASPTSQMPKRPRSGTSPVRACSSRASWPIRSPSRPTPAGAGRGLRTFAPRLA